MGLLKTDDFTSSVLAQWCYHLAKKKIKVDRSIKARLTSLAVLQSIVGLGTVWWSLEYQQCKNLLQQTTFAAKFEPRNEARKQPYINMEEAHSWAW